MDEVLAQLAASHQRLIQALDGLTDATTRSPSRLPGWSIGHVLAHVARNADSVVRRLEGAARDEVVDQYPGGRAGREAEIEAGAFRPASELIDDVRATSLAAERAAAAVPDQAWDRLCRSLDGSLQPARRVVTTRIREVELHHVDLGLGYEPEAWPESFVRDELDVALETLAGRADPAALLAWLTGRGAAPALSPWP